VVEIHNTGQISEDEKDRFILGKAEGGAPHQHSTGQKHERDNVRGVQGRSDHLLYYVALVKPSSKSFSSLNNANNEYLFSGDREVNERYWVETVMDPVVP